MTDHGSWTKVLTHAARVSNPASRFGARFAQQADKVAMSPEHCVVYLARKVGEARQARRRARWSGGRIVNWLTGAEPSTITISGTVFAESLKWMGENVPNGVPRGADLAFPFETVAELEADMRAFATERGLLK